MSVVAQWNDYGFMKFVIQIIVNRLDILGGKFVRAFFD